MNIRKPTRADLPDIRQILADTELFPIDMLEGMIEPCFSDPECDEKWLVLDPGDGAIGFAYCRPEPLTDGVWNLLAIGLRTAHQGRGFGTQLVRAVEENLVGGRILIVETSGLEAFMATRAFYAKLGYDLEATIRDYWADGDDKVIFRKLLG